MYRFAEVIFERFEHSYLHLVAGVHELCEEASRTE